MQQTEWQFSPILALHPSNDLAASVSKNMDLTCLIPLDFFSKDPERSRSIPILGLKWNVQSLL
jgi:hypothetical protein